MEFIHDDEDVMMRMKNEDGKELTFITAPGTAFPEDDLGPIVTGFEGQVIVAFNSDKLEQMITESVEINGDTYGEAAAAFLPISLILQKGMKAADEYLRNNSI
jgi:hypothetical protein